MACYYPLKAFRDSDGIRFVASATLSNLRLACGQCFGCRLERSRQWAIRCMHEAQLHAHNCFITLTLSNDHLVNKYFTGRYDRKAQPIYSGTLNKEHHQKFLKRLRKALGSKRGEKALATTIVGRTRSHGATPHTPIRYYMAGEYGEQFARPHYHLCIFGLDFKDKLYWGTTPAGSKLYRSPLLEQLWPFGHSTVGALTYESAAYTARYVIQKINGKKAEKHYEVMDHDTGEILRLLPEYNEMSRAQGIGKNWIEKYKADVYDALPGKVIHKGKEANSPRYYDKQLKEWDPDKYELLTAARFRAAQQSNDSTKARLAVREKVARAKTKSLKRTI